MQFAIFRVSGSGFQNYKIIGPNAGRVFFFCFVHQFSCRVSQNKRTIMPAVLRFARHVRSCWGVNGPMHGTYIALSADVSREDVN